MTNTPNTAPTLADDTSSPQAIVNAIYRLISGNAGDPRDWDRLKKLYAPGARLIPIEDISDENIGPNVLNPDEWIASRSPLFSAEDFWEWETSREQHSEGSIVHVWSAYEAARTLHGPAIRRGVNSIQLWNDGNRWWVLSTMWDAIAAKKAVQ